MTQVRVLLVDDNKKVRKTLSDWLSRFPGVSVFAQAATGSEALAELQRTWPDLVLTDVEMPGMSGFELALRITKMASAPRVVLMSECDDLPCYEQLSRLAGADAHMNKTKLYEPLSRYLTTHFGVAAHPAAVQDAYAGRDNGNSMPVQGRVDTNDGTDALQCFQAGNTAGVLAELNT